MSYYLDLLDDNIIGVILSFDEIRDILRFAMINKSNYKRITQFNSIWNSILVNWMKNKLYEKQVFENIP